MSTSAWLPAAQADPTVFVDPPSLLFYPGDTATLEVRVDDSGDPISCFIVQIHFDPAVFAVNDVIEGMLFTSSGLPTYPDSQLVAPDTLQLANCVLGSGTFVLGPGELVAMQIEALAPGYSPVELAFAQVRDIDRIPYGMTGTEDGEVYVWDPTGVADPAGGMPAAGGRLVVSPNPAPGWARIALSGRPPAPRELHEPATVDIYDIHGRHRGSLRGVSRDDGVLWNASGESGRWSAGVYLLRVRHQAVAPVRVLLVR